MNNKGLAVLYGTLIIAASIGAILVLGIWNAQLQHRLDHPKIVYQTATSTVFKEITATTTEYLTEYIPTYIQSDCPAPETCPDCPIKELEASFEDYKLQAEALLKACEDAKHLLQTDLSNCQNL